MLSMEVCQPLCAKYEYLDHVKQECLYSDDLAELDRLVGTIKKITAFVFF